MVTKYWLTARMKSAVTVTSPVTVWGTFFQESKAYEYCCVAVYGVAVTSVEPMVRTFWAVVIGVP